MLRGKEFTKVQELAYKLTVRDAMVRNPVTVCSDVSMRKLRDIFRLKRISGVPVVDGNKLTGIVSLEDFIKALVNKELDSLIRDKMTKKVRVLYADEPLVQAISKFDAYGFGRFPVLNRESGKLTGIITKGDIIKALLKKLEIDYHEEEIHKYRASHIFEDITSDKTVLTFEYNVKSMDFKSAGSASSRLKKSLIRLGVKPQITRRVAIATFEAEMNIVIFTTAGGKITAYVEPDKVRIIAEDNGPGIKDIKKAFQPGFSTAPEWVREMGFGAGMGLPNIKHCSNKLTIDSKIGKGTRLEFIINGGKNETKKINKRIIS